ncbi:MAG TPA: exodeoxyribonuclease V subunit gamma [Polyangia bacterium]
MIRFCCSNRLEALVEALADTVGAGRTSLFDPVSLVVPNTLVEGYVKQGLARRLGIAANVETGFLRGFLRKVAAASTPDSVIADRDLLEGALLELLHDPGWLSGPELGPVREYLGGGGDALDADGRDRKRVQLAAELAGLYDEYAFSRPEMLAAWREGALVPEADAASQRWQREVWLALQGPGGLLARRGIVTLPDFFARTPVEALRPPPVVHVFGISYVARLYGAIFQTLGRATDLFVYALAPDRATASGAEGPPAEMSALDLWARPGRDNAQLLARLAAGSVDARFVDPPGGARAPLLAAVQKAALERAPIARGKRASDDSLTVVRATDPRRELETIAAQIWSRVRSHETLTFADFAVVVPQASAAVYLPLAQAVFDEASGLPHTIVDLPRASERRILDVVALLLELPLGSLGRPDLLRVAMHPAVARRFPEVDPEQWLALCEALEIVRGADRASEPPSYLERDRTSWDQGLRRLALGAFLSGPRAGEERPFVLDGEAMLPFDLPPDLEPAARALGMMARALIAFAHAARGAPAPFASHAALFRRIVAETVLPEAGDEEAALGDALRVLETLEAGLPVALPISFRVAAELVKARLGAAARRHRAPEGVTVASFVPMRALPFRHIFVAGLDERAFPAADGGRALDLRAGTRHPGDVSPREQDEHMFLETLLAARERITLSYVARDPVTGEEKSPSSVVRALLDLLEPERADDGSSEIVRPRPPLARHEDPAACAVIPAAARERRAAALGASVRRANGGARQLPPLGELRGTLGAGVWERLGAELGWAAPPAVEGSLRARRGLTLTDLRRFLECPLQASARVLLPVAEEGDAMAEAEAALREHEPLDEVRAETVPFLRDLTIGAVAQAPGADLDGDRALAAAYDRAAELRRLQGMLPDGLFGRAMRKRHLRLCACWRRGLLQATGGLGAAPAHVWLGAAPEHQRDVLRRPTVGLRLSDGSALALGGRTALCGETSGGSRVVVSLHASTSQDKLERDLLGPFFTHLALAALGDGERPTRALIIRPDKDDEPCVDERLFLPISGDAAGSYLALLAGELLRDVHAYFLPCEGVFYWKDHTDKGEEIGIRQSILLLRDDNWTRFASDHGPIPDAREYPVPDESTAAALVERRFAPFFAATAPVESAPRRKRR